MNHQADGQEAQSRPLLELAILLMVFAFADWWLRHVTRLPEDSFREPFIFWAFLKHLLRSGWWLAPLVPLCVIVVARRRELGCRWSDLQHGETVRIIVVVSALLLTWMFGTYDFNYFFDRAHLADRFLLVLLLAAVVWRPLFVAAFLMVLLPLTSQFAVPLRGFTWSVPYVAIRVMALFASFFLLCGITRRWATPHFAAAICCLFAIHYWPSGLGKVQTGWLFRDQVCFLLPSTYANGWLGFLEPESINQLTRCCCAVNMPIKLITLALECGAIVFLWSRATMIVCLIGWILLHAGIFSVTGICFWPWVVLDAVLLWLVCRRREFFTGIFSKQVFLASVIVIGSAPLWLQPVKLSWLDTRATYTYRFNALGEDDQLYRLPPGFFEPYLYEFTLSLFPYLSPRPVLPIAWGATSNLLVAERLKQAVTSEDVVAIEEGMGQVRYDAVRAKTLQRFVTTFVTNYNRRQTGLTMWLSHVQAPAILWTFSPPQTFPGNQRIKRVDVEQVLSFFSDDVGYVEIRATPVCQIPIRSDSAD